jgi:TolB-like protein/Tfp pilus assembly protein PilF
MTDDGSTGGSPTSPKADQAASPNNAVGQVFVSHASADTAIAEEVCAALERAGVRCWIAPRDVMPGALYADAIVRAISNAKVVVLLLSENAVASPHVGKEIERSTSKRRPIVALRIDAAPLTPAFEYFLSESQWIDAQATGLATALPRLIEALRQILAPDAPTAPRNAENGANVPHPGPYRTEEPTERGKTQRANAAAASRISRRLIAAIAILAAGLLYVLADKFWLRSNTGAISTPAPTASAVADNSIAVLPFTDMSEKKDQEYFSDGLSEELIDLLTKIPQLRVPARTSSFYFKNRPEDIPTIAKKLLVAHVLEGSVRKSGDRLRVTAQLIRADNGYHLWSETYDRKLDDVFKVQDEIANAVVGALKLKLLAAPVVADRQTSNPEAYNQYLIGRHLLSGGENWALDRTAIEPLRKALELDPGYVQAWAALADATFFAAEGSSASVAELVAERRKAEDLANKAIALGPDLAAGYGERGFIRAWGSWDFQGAGEDFKRALALEPEDSNVIEQYAAAVLMPLGRLDEAIPFAEKVVKADPLNSHAWRRLGALQYMRGDYEAAVPSFQRSLEISPEQSNTAAFLSYDYLLLKKPELALSMAQRSTVELFRHQASALAEHDLGHAREAQKSLDEILAKDATEGAYQIAEVYAWFGNKDQAFGWLDRAYLQHDGGLTLLKVDPLLRVLRPDPRYNVLLSKLKLQD